MPRAGPLRYWSLTLLGVAVLLVSAAALVWGTVNLIGTESCGTQTTHECSSETGLHITAVVLAPFAAGFGGVLLAFRGGGTMRRWRRDKRVADMVARGEMPAPVVKRPTSPPPQLPSDPPSTWKPGGT